MGFVKDTFNAITGRDAAKASERAGQIGAEASVRAAEIGQETAREGIAFQRESLEQVRGDLAPFVGAGRGRIGEVGRQLDALNTLIGDPNAQASFIQDNPFFNAVSADAERRLLNNRAARGKVGSGGTAEALQNSLIVLGNDFLNQDVNRRLSGINANQNVVVAGQNAAAQTGTATQQAGNAITQLTQAAGDAAAGGVIGAANATAAGTVGAANARTQATNNLLTLGTVGALQLCDRRFKTDVNIIGESNEGFPIYIFRYAGQKELVIGPMAQDVEKIQPDAVVELYGIKYIDFSRLQWSSSIH